MKQLELLELHRWQVLLCQRHTWESFDDADDIFEKVFDDNRDLLEEVYYDGDDKFEKVSDDAKDILEKVSDDGDDIFEKVSDDAKDILVTLKHCFKVSNVSPVSH